MGWRRFLAFSFWGVSTLGLTMLQIPNWIILAQGDEIFDTMSDIGALFYLVYLIVLFVAVVIAYVGCWRSAAKYIATKIKKKKSAFWGVYCLCTYSYLNRKSFCFNNNRILNNEKIPNYFHHKSILNSTASAINFYKSLRKI